MKKCSGDSSLFYHIKNQLPTPIATTRDQSTTSLLNGKTAFKATNRSTSLLRTTLSPVPSMHPNTSCSTHQDGSNLDVWAAERKSLNVSSTDASSSHSKKRRLTNLGFQVPRTPAEAIELNKANGNTKWQDAMQLKIDLLMDYETFEDLGRTPRSLKVTS